MWPLQAVAFLIGFVSPSHPSCCFSPIGYVSLEKKNEEGVGAVAPSSCWFLCFPFHLQPHAPGPPGRLIPLQSFVHARWYPQRVPQSQKKEKKDHWTSFCCLFI